MNASRPRKAPTECTLLVRFTASQAHRLRGVAAGLGVPLPAAIQIALQVAETLQRAGHLRVQPAEPGPPGEAPIQAEGANQPMLSSNEAEKKT